MPAAGGVGTSLSDISAILKEFYLPPVTEQLNNEVLLISRLEQRDQELFGNQAVVPLHSGRSAGVGARGEGVILPAADKQRFAKAVYDLKYLYGRVRVTGPSMAKTANERGSFLEILRAELDGIRNDLKRDLARQIYGFGTSAIVKCGVTTASATVVLASAADETSPSGSEAITKGWVYVGMIVDIGTAADADVIAADRTITAVTPATPSITISGATVTTSASHFVSRANASAAALSAADSYEISGLREVVSGAASAFGGIDASTAGNEYWDNMRSLNGGTPRALSLDLMLEAWNNVKFKGGQVSAIITSMGLLRKYFGLLQAQVRYNDPMKFDSGWQTLDFMGKPLIGDIDAPFGRMYFLDESFLKIYANKDWHFLDEDGDMLKWVVDYDAWEAVLAKYFNLGATRRNVQYLLSDLTDTGI